MKKYLTKSNILTAAIFAVVLFLQAPTWFANSGVEKKHVYNFKLKNIETNQEIIVDKSQNYIFFFWATWCAPCKLEMERYRTSIKDKKIPKGNFWAINPFEPVHVIKKFLKQNPYPFTFIDDGNEISRALEVRATPTATFIEKGRVLRQSTGISLIGIYRAEWFFD